MMAGVPPSSRCWVAQVAVVVRRHNWTVLPPGTTGTSLWSKSRRTTEHPGRARATDELVRGEEDGVLVFAVAGGRRCISISTYGADAAKSQKREHRGHGAGAIWPRCPR